MGMPEALGAAYLARHDRLRGFGSEPVTLYYARHLLLLAAVDHEDALCEFAIGAGFDQQRHDDYDISGMRGAHRGIDLGAYHRMQYRFEFLFCRRVGKNQLPHAVAVERAVGAQVIRTELRADRARTGLSWRGQTMRDFVGIYDGGAEFPEHRGDGALAAADTAGESDD